MSFYYPTTGAGLILKRQKLQVKERLKCDWGDVFFKKSILSSGL